MRRIALLLTREPALVDAMEKCNADFLGDLFQDGITYGEAGQYFTPESVCS